MLLHGISKAMCLLCLSSLALIPRVVSAQEPSSGYNTRWRNTDGSSKLMVEFAGGFDTTAGATRRYQTSGWNYRMGAGYRLKRRLGAMIEYNYDHFSVPQPLVDSIFVSTYYGNQGVVGRVHLWSLTLQPTFEVVQTEHYGLYLTGGGGFYRKVTVFSESTSKCNPTGSYVNVCVLGSSGEYRLSNNAGGMNVGAGIARRISDSSNAKLFIEGRYVWVDNTPSSHNTAYPPANQRTGYFPVSAGVRW
jgi:hypothetical protein